MHPVRRPAPSTAEDGESTAAVRDRVAAAREAAAERWRAARRPNQRRGAAASLLRRRFRLEPEVMAPLRTALDRGVLSIRGVDRTLRVAWTLADLGGRTSPELDDVATALSFRQPGGVQMSDDARLRAGRTCRGWPSRRARSWPTLVADVGPVEAAERGQGGRCRRGPCPSHRSSTRRSTARQRISSCWPRRGGRLITADDAEWPLLAFTAFAGVDHRLRPQAHPPMVLWAVGPARLDDVAERAVGDRRNQGVHRVRRARRRRPGRRSGRARRRGGVGRRIRHRRRGAPRDAGRRRVHRRGAGRRHRRAIPGRACRAAASDRRSRACVVSEYPPGVRPARHRFLTRNRLVAALSGATVVVEAGAAQRGGEHRGVGAGAGPRGVRGARAR